ncbi:MAG: hypothetical protein HOV67_14320 [Kribbellaceae bacterium]|nr:hypothetical protein [Catenulispora sp.]NUR96420.1 hypothetical protein [Kribbellaceae bacterium]
MLKLTPAYVAAAFLLAAATGCSGSSDSAAPSTAPTSSTPSAPASTTPPTTTTATPAATTTTLPTTPPAPSATTTTRTVKQLTAALLALADLPPGVSIDDDSGAGGPDPVVSSKDSRCAKLVALTNADVPPGSKASASRSFSASEQGPFIDEGLDGMGSPAAVQALQQTLRKAITSCRTLTLSIPGEGKSPITVREVSAPKVGSNPVAVRYAATGGPLEGLEITMVTTGVQDVLVSVTVIAGLPDDITGATTAAVQKATKTLGSKSGT